MFISIFLVYFLSFLLCFKGSKTNVLKEIIFIFLSFFLSSNKSPWQILSILVIRFILCIFLEGLPVFDNFIDWSLKQESRHSHFIVTSFLKKSKCTQQFYKSICYIYVFKYCLRQYMCMCLCLYSICLSYHLKLSSMLKKIVSRVYWSNGYKSFPSSRLTCNLLHNEAIKFFVNEHYHILINLQ